MIRLAKFALAWLGINTLLTLGWMIAFIIECFLHYELRDETRPLVALLAWGMPLDDH